MKVDIDHVDTTARVMDGDALLAPKTLQKIVRAVLQAVNDQEDHHARVRAEQKITGGVRAEQEDER